LQCKKKLTWRTSKTRGNPQTWLILLRKNHEVPGFGLNQLDAPMAGSNFLATLSTCWASQWLWTYTYNSFGNARRQRLMWRSLVATSVALNLRRTSKWPQQKGGIDHTEPSKGDVTIWSQLLSMLPSHSCYPVVIGIILFSPMITRDNSIWEGWKSPTRIWVRGFAGELKDSFIVVEKRMGRNE
jgi:hypothetical protein